MERSGTKHNMKRKLKKKLKNIKLVVMDFDGVWTNNHVFFDDKGNQSVICNMYDSLGIKMIHNIGIKTAIITAHDSGVSPIRAKELNIDYHTTQNKLQMFKKILKEIFIDSKEAIYIGNDMNDASCISYAGIGIAVKDSHIFAIENADYVTKNEGGEGAIREICDLIIKIKKMEKHKNDSFDF